MLVSGSRVSIYSQFFFRAPGFQNVRRRCCAPNTSVIQGSSNTNPPTWRMGSQDGRKWWSDHPYLQAMKWPFIRGTTLLRGLLDHGYEPLTNWDDPPSRELWKESQYIACWVSGFAPWGVLNRKVWNETTLDFSNFWNWYPKGSMYSMDFFMFL